MKDIPSGNQTGCLENGPLKSAIFPLKPSMYSIGDCPFSTAMFDYQRVFVNQKYLDAIRINIYIFNDFMYSSIDLDIPW